MTNEEQNLMQIYVVLLEQLKKGAIITKSNLEEASTKRGVYILWFDKKTCLKVGIATPRRKNGLKGRLSIHFRSSLGNSVLARHLKADTRLAKRFNLDFSIKGDRQQFIREQCHFQILPLPDFSETCLRQFEKFLEKGSGLKPLYCGRIIQRT